MLGAGTGCWWSVMMLDHCGVLGTVVVVGRTVPEPPHFPQAWSGTFAPGAWLAVVDVLTTTVSLNRGCGRGRARGPDPEGSVDGDGSVFGSVSGGAPGRSGKPS